MGGVLLPIIFCDLRFSFEFTDRFILYDRPESEIYIFLK